MLKDELTTKQRAFVDAYLANGFNATQAAIDAGYSEKTARAIGSENLTKPDIAAAISDFLDAHAMTAKEVLFHLTEIARGDIGEVIDGYGNLDLREARKKNKTRLIKRIKNKTFTTEQGDSSEQEIELYDRLQALGLLAKYHDLTNRVKVDDWRSEAVRLIQRNEVTFDALSNEFGYDLATSLFTQAGVNVGHAIEAGTGERTE